MIETATQTRAEWLEERKTGIGASEAAAALGVCPFKSRLQLWGEKTGRLEPEDLSQVERVQWGSYLQPKIAEVYAERTGREVGHNTDNVIHRHHDHDWMLATLDASQRDNGGPVGVLEIKTTSAWNRDEWADQPPLYYQVQVAHQLAVTGYDWGTLAVLVGGQELRWFDLERNEKFIAAMELAEHEFWELVQRGEPPEVDGSLATTEALKRLYSSDDGTEIMLPSEAATWDADLQNAKAAIKAAEAQKREAENKIKAAIGEATVGLLPGGGRYSFKTTERNDPPREAKTVTFRTLRRHKK